MSIFGSDGGGVLGGLGQSGGVDSDTVWMAQAFLNEELKKRGLPEVRMDGVLDRGTCEGLVEILRRVQAGEPVDDSFADFMRENGALFDAPCQSILGAETATSSSPLEPTAAALTAISLCDGIFGAAARGSENHNVCTLYANQMLLAGTPAAQVADALRPKAGAPPADVPSDDDPYSKCWIEFGDEGSHVADVQSQVNRKLDEKGYEPIDVTGVWDAATCGAIFFLKGEFEPEPVADCAGSGYVVPLECPDVLEPVKKGGERRMGMWLLGGAVAAAAVGTGIWFFGRRA